MLCRPYHILSAISQEIKVKIGALEEEQISWLRLNKRSLMAGSLACEDEAGSRYRREFAKLPKVLDYI